MTNDRIIGVTLRLKPKLPCRYNYTFPCDDNGFAFQCGVDESDAWEKACKKLSPLGISVSEKSIHEVELNYICLCE